MEKFKKKLLFVFLFVIVGNSILYLMNENHIGFNIGIVAGLIISFYISEKNKND
jgi:hypothetical protein